MGVRFVSANYTDYPNLVCYIILELHSAFMSNTNSSIFIIESSIGCLDIIGHKRLCWVKYTLNFVKSTSLMSIWANQRIHSFLVGCLNPCLQGTNVRVGSPQPLMSLLLIYPETLGNGCCLFKMSPLIVTFPSHI